MLAMTKHEAIARLEIIATNLTGEWASAGKDEAVAKYYSKHIAALDMAIAALKARDGDCKIYRYCVNTFQETKSGLVPTTESGYVSALSESDAINQLIRDGIVCPTGYEFLELCEVEQGSMKG